MLILNVKLSFVKQFVTTLSEKSTVYKFLPDTFPMLSEANARLRRRTGKECRSAGDSSKKLTLKGKASSAGGGSRASRYHKAENPVEAIEALVRNSDKMCCKIAFKSIFLTLNLVSSAITWGRTR